MVTALTFMAEVPIIQKPGLSLSYRNQVWSGFHMIGVSVMKELSYKRYCSQISDIYIWFCNGNIDNNNN